MSAIHVAIIDSRTAAKVLDGRKKVESRFARHRRLPYGRVYGGDSIYFKVSGGDIIGHSSAVRVRSFDELTPRSIDALRREYNRDVLAPPEYWRARRGCRYGVLIWLTRFVPQPTHLNVPRQYGSGWIVLSPATA